MIDEEVEKVLREIRERVISQPLAQPSLTEPPAGGANGNQHSQAVATAETSALSSAAMARLNAHLTTTARAWDRLPPVFSNRSGTGARIEVWLKARLKIFSRWFTWEQVNFNAAVHHALLETLQALTEQDAAIAAVRAQLSQLQTNAQAEGEALRAEIDNQYAEINSLRAQLQVDAAALAQNHLRETNALRAELRGEMESVRIRTEDQGADLQVRIETATNEAATNLAALSSELRDREDRLENEQRVCFKQVSLETNEIAVSGERAQQRISTLIEEMNQRIKQLEDSQQQTPRS
jgi:vacuolar-type H+-ATPase subunit I/STV1